MNSYLEFWFAILSFVVLGVISSILFFRRYPIRRRKPEDLDSVLFKAEK
ncbi:MAG: hypothetical protein NVS2B12_03710 [Ktedonobacteraceae bacterium]